MYIASNLDFTDLGSNKAVKFLVCNNIIIIEIMKTLAYLWWEMYMECPQINRNYSSSQEMCTCNNIGIYCVFCLGYSFYYCPSSLITQKNSTLVPLRRQNDIDY